MPSQTHKSLRPVAWGWLKSCYSVCSLQSITPRAPVVFKIHLVVVAVRVRDSVTIAFPTDPVPQASVAAVPGVARVIRLVQVFPAEHAIVTVLVCWASCFPISSDFLWNLCPLRVWHFQVLSSLRLFIRAEELEPLRTTIPWPSGSALARLFPSAAHAWLVLQTLFVLPHMFDADVSVCTIWIVNATWPVAFGISFLPVRLNFLPAYGLHRESSREDRCDCNEVFHDLLLWLN